MDRSSSDTNVHDLSLQNTPPNFASLRNNSKRRRQDEPSESNLPNSEFSNFQEEMRTMISTLFAKHEAELKKLGPTLKEIQQTNLKIENSIAFLTSQNEEFKQKINRLHNESKKDKEHISLLEEKIEEMERASRKTSIEIKNVPKKPDENKSDLLNIVQKLSKSVDCSIQLNEIKDIYRVRGKKDTKNAPIIVETSSTILRTNILKSTKTFNIKNKDKLRAKHLGFTTNEDTPVYVSERLTAKGSRLYFLARDLSRSKNYKYCWTSFGKVYVRKDDNSPIIAMKSEDQVNQLLQNT